MLLYNCQEERTKKGKVNEMMNIIRKMKVTKAVMIWTANHTGLPFKKVVFINGFKDVDIAFTEEELEKVWNDLIANGTIKSYKGTDLYTI